jgi:phospholipid/cholesterol/gamma-HCH transport system permease protein
MAQIATVDGARVGPYDSRASHLAEGVPARVRNPLVEVGGMTLLLGRVVASAVRHPRGYWTDAADHMWSTLARAWLPISVALFGFLVFMSIMSVQFFDMVGASQLFGPLLFLQSIRTFTMWINSMVVAGVVGTALTADIGARKVRDELAAMRVMGIDPVRDLGVPRVVSITAITAIIAVPSLIVTMVSMQLGAAFVAGMPAADFYSNLFSNVSGIEIASVVVNSVLVGLLIGTVCLYKGLNASGGANGLGRSVNQAVVTSFVAIWILQLAYNAVFLGLFPNLGVMR